MYPSFNRIVKNITKALYFYINAPLGNIQNISNNTTFAWPVDYEKQKHHSESPLFTYECTSKGVKYWLFLGKYGIKAVKLKDCKTK